MYSLFLWANKHVRMYLRQQCDRCQGLSWLHRCRWDGHTAVMTRSLESRRQGWTENQLTVSSWRGLVPSYTRCQHSHNSQRAEHISTPVHNRQFVFSTVMVKVNGKVKSICIARLLEHARILITQCYLQTTSYLPLPVSIPQAAPPCIIYSQRKPEFNILLIYRPQEDEWLSWPCWLTYSGRFTPRRSPVNCTSWHRTETFASVTKPNSMLKTHTEQKLSAFWVILCFSGWISEDLVWHVFT